MNRNHTTDVMRGVKTTKEVTPVTCHKIGGKGEKGNKSNPVSISTRRNHPEAPPPPVTEIKGKENN